MLGFLKPYIAAQDTGGGGARDPSDEFWYRPIFSKGKVPPNQLEAMSTVSACIRVISESIGILPLQVFTRDDQGNKEAQPNHPLHDLLQWQPNEEQTAIEFREELTAYAVARGTGVAEIADGPRGAVDQLIPLHPDHIEPVEVEDASGRKQWQLEVRENGAPVRRLLREDLFIVRGRRDPTCPLLGIDPLTFHMQGLGAAWHSNDYSSRFLQNDARPPGIITHPGNFRDPEARNLFMRAWQAAFGGSNRGKTAVLEYGMTYNAISVTPEQAQLIDSLKYRDVDVARIFRVPPHAIGILDRATFSNIEHQALEFVKTALMRWLVGWEQAIRRDLIVAKGRYFAEHNVAGLLRGDLKSRYDAYGKGRQWGWLSVNEIRRMENLASIEEGDTYLEPENMRHADDDPDDEPPPPRPVREDDE